MWGWGVWGLDGRPLGRAALGRAALGRAAPGKQKAGVPCGYAGPNLINGAQPPAGAVFSRWPLQPFGPAA